MCALRRIILLASALAFASCSRSHSGSLKVSARGEGTPGIASVDLGNGISVSRVRVLVRELELEGTVASMKAAMTLPAAGASHDDGDREDDGEVEIGPFVVDVSGTSLAGSVTRVFDADVPDGTYRELEIVVGPAAGAAAGTPVGDMGGSSVIIDGTRGAIGGSPASDFHLTSSLTAEQELETTLVVDHAAKTSNVTLVLELKKWFTAGDGRTLDPTVAADRATIEANILASLRFERDDDENGEDDDHDGGDHSGPH